MASHSHKLIEFDFPQSPPNSDDSQSPILISDSEDDHNGYSESENEMETEWLGKFFSASTNSFVQKSLADDKLRIQAWLLQIYRKCRMLAEIYYIQKNSKNPLQPCLRADIDNNCDSQRLTHLMNHVKERNRENKTSFFLFEELENILKNTTNCALLDPAIYSKICFILEDFALGSSLSEDNFPILQNFLKARYRARNSNMESIFVAWKSSNDYSCDLEMVMLHERKFIQGLLWGPVMLKLESMLMENANVLPTIMEIGAFDVQKLRKFLETFNISYSGPYKKLCPNGSSRPKVLFYISSMNNCDSICNGGFPLYGCYEFNAAAVNKSGQESGLQYIANLDVPPYWLSIIPPIFNETLGNFQRKLYGI